MFKRLVGLGVVVLTAVACTAAVASWTPTVMEAVGTTETLLLTPSWSAGPGGTYNYSYDLTNPTADDYIVGFTLTFPTSVPVTSFTSIVSPTGWSASVRALSNKVAWELGGDSQYALGPGQTKTYGFTSTYAPGTEKDVNSSSQDRYGFSGMTFGPVPEPGSLLALATGLVGLAGLKLRRVRPQ